MRKRRAFLINSTVLLLIIPLMLLLATYEDVSSQIIVAQSERTQVERTYRVVSYLEMDFEKALELSGKRAVVAAVDYVAVMRSFISPAYGVNNTISDLILTGTSSSMPGYDFNRVMKGGQSVENWLVTIADKLREQGYEFLIANKGIDEIMRRNESARNSFLAKHINLTVAPPLDSFRIVVLGRIPNATLKDLSGTVIYTGPLPRNGPTRSIISIRNLEDPLFSAMTGGRYQRSIRACSYPFPELIDRPIKVLEGKGSSTSSPPVIGKYSPPTLKGGYIFYGNSYPGSGGADGYVLREGDTTGITKPAIVNTTLNGKKISPPLDVFNDNDMGVLVFDGVSAGGGTPGGWCSNYQNWKHRKPITIDNTQNPNTLTDYQVKVELDSTNFDFSKAKADGSDIRFADSSCNSLPYWIEKWDTTTGKAIVWVRVPYIPAYSTTTIYMYYDNPSASSESDGTKVFDFFDDMETWTGWRKYGKGQVSQDSSRRYEGTYSAHKTKNNDPNGAWKALPKPLGRDIIVESWINRNSASTGGNWDRVGVVDDNGNGYGSAANIKGNKARIDVRTGMSASAHSYNTITTIPTDVWYLQRLIIMSNGTIRVELEYPEGTVVASGSITDTQYSNFTNYYIAGGYDYWVDLVRIRKYANPEPRVSAGGAEETIPTSSTTYSNARAYDLQPFIDCIQDNRYFGIYGGGWSFFERLEGSSTNHDAYVTLAHRMQDELGVKYGDKYYPIGLVSFMIPHANYDEKLFNLFNTLGISVEEGQSSVDYYFLNYYFKGGSKVSGFRVWGGISQGVTSSGDLSTIPFFLDEDTAEAIFGKQGAEDLLQR